MPRTRHESSVIAVSWIPSEAIEGLSRIPFDLGVTHYDEPPPDQLVDLEELRRTDRFREANELRAYVDLEDGAIVGYGYLGADTSGRRPSDSARRRFASQPSTCPISSMSRR